MPRINVRLDDVQGSFVLLPEANYLVELQESSKVISKAGKAPYIRWIAKILEGDYEGKAIMWQTSLGEEALWNLKSMLEVIGLAWEEDGFDLEDTFGKTLIVEVYTDEYEGQPRNKVRNYFKV